jgi:hypothetical protein
MRIIEGDLHARQQTLAIQDTTTRLGLEPAKARFLQRSRELLGLLLDTFIGRGEILEAATSTSAGKIDP